jgi:hypothetical protein
MIAIALYSTRYLNFTCMNVPFSDGPYASDRDIKDSELKKRRNQAKQQPNEGDLSQSLKALSKSIQSIKNK